MLSVALLAVNIALSAFVARRSMPHARDRQRATGELSALMLEMLRGMVAHGLGVSMLFTRPSHDLTHDGKPVLCLPIRDRIAPQRLVAAYAETGPMTATARAALAVIRAHFSG